MKIKKTNFWNLFAVIMVMVIAIAACGSPSTSSASCAFVVGDGAYDRDLYETLLPGETPVTTDFEYRDFQYYPCNSRNYLVTFEKKTDVAGDLGDRPWPIELKTPSGTGIEVAASAFWTPSQDKKAMKALFTVFEKYGATSDSETQDGKVNASSPGWNKMLSENFGPTMDAIALQAMYNIQHDYDSLIGENMVHTVKINEDIWKNKDKRQMDELANEMSRLFSADVSKRLGFKMDLFCGSGNSLWIDPETKNPTTPGIGTYYCAPVRIEVNDVRPINDQGDTGSQGLNESNQQRYDAAEKLYGDQTSCWLGILDSIKACGETPNCNVILESNQCQNPDGSDADGTIILLPNPPTPTLEGGTVPVPTATP